MGRSRSEAPGPADPTGFFFQEATTGVYLLSYLELIFTKLTDGGSDQGQTNSSGSFAVFM